MGVGVAVRVVSAGMIVSRESLGFGVAFCIAYLKHLLRVQVNIPQSLRNCVAPQTKPD